MDSGIEQSATPIMSRKDAAVAIMRVIRGVMRQMGRLYRDEYTRTPRSYPGEYIMVLSTELPNRKRDLVGKTRVRVRVPEDQDLPIHIRLEWTRDAFGFWYQQEEFFDNLDDPTNIVLKWIVDAMRPVKYTADGTVNTASMNRGYRKRKKNKVMDKAAMAGLSLGQA